MVKVTIGQHYPADSFIHRLDARMKLLCTLLFVVFIFFINNFIGYAVAAVYLIVVVKASTVPPRFLLRGLRAIFFIIIFTAVLNIFFTAGETTLVQWGGVRISLEGLLNAARMALRLVMLIIGS
ncbi:MAG: energy-coupling factor transporter transmembrane protein EcfT, partial [Defluviitaleaceae bacterium]|nr:energy-coupling factor transporter transmembrane protein EcfT [Defluviitaleaceae bacterium]